MVITVAIDFLLHWCIIKESWKNSLAAGNFARGQIEFGTFTRTQGGRGNVQENRSLLFRRRWRWHHSLRYRVRVRHGDGGGEDHGPPSPVLAGRACRRRSYRQRGRGALPPRRSAAPAGVPGPPTARGDCPRRAPRGGVRELRPAAGARLHAAAAGAGRGGAAGGRPAGGVPALVLAGDRGGGGRPHQRP